MKITIEEFDCSFSIDLIAETPADASLLARLKMNAKKEAPRFGAEARKDSFTGWVTLQKKKDTTSYIPTP